MIVNPGGGGYSIHFDYFGLESGMVFEGTKGVYERFFIVSHPKE